MSRENLPPSGARPRGTPAGGVSISTSLSVIVAAIAVLLGFLILRDVNRDRDGLSFDPGVEVPTGTGDLGASSLAPTATPAPDRTGFKVLVANASGAPGSAGQMTTALQAQQFVVTQPLNADPAVGKLTTTLVYYVPGFEAQATLVADVLGGVQILPVPTPPPVEGGTLGEATVLVMLGGDLAGKMLPGALPSATPVTPETTTTIAAPVGG